MYALDLITPQAARHLQVVILVSLLFWHAASSKQNNKMLFTFAVCPCLIYDCRFRQRLHWTHARARAHTHGNENIDLYIISLENTFWLQLICVASFGNWQCAPLMSVKCLPSKNTIPSIHTHTHVRICLESFDGIRIVLKRIRRNGRDHEPDTARAFDLRWHWAWEMCSIVKQTQITTRVIDQWHWWQLITFTMHRRSDGTRKSPHGEGR